MYEQEGNDLDDQIVGMIDDGKDQCHYTHRVAILPRPESSIAVEVSLEVELLADLFLVVVLEIVFDTLVQKPL